MSAPIPTAAAAALDLERFRDSDLAPDLHHTAVLIAHSLTGILHQLEQRVQLQRQAALRAEHFNKEAVEMLRLVTLELCGLDDGAAVEARIQRHTAEFGDRR